MKLREKWKELSAWEKTMIIIRDFALYAMLLSALPYVLGYFDNSLLVLVCLPLSAISQASLSWKRDRKTALLFLFGAIFVFAMYAVSMAG